MTMPNIDMSLVFLAYACVVCLGLITSATLLIIIIRILRRMERKPWCEYHN